MLIPAIAIIRTGKYRYLLSSSKLDHLNSGSTQMIAGRSTLHPLLRTNVALTQKEIPRRDEKREPFSCELSLKPKNPAKWFCMEGGRLRRDEMHLLTAYEILG